MAAPKSDSGQPKNENRYTVQSDQGPSPILVVIPKLPVGGTEKHLLEVLPRLDRRRFAVTLFTTRGAGALDDRLRAKGVTVKTAPGIFPGQWNVIIAGFTLLGVLLKLRPAVVHFFLPEAYLIGGLCSLLTGRCRRIMSRRSLNHYQQQRPLSARLERWLHKRMDAVLGNSQKVVDQLRDEGVVEDRLGLIPNGIDMARYSGGDKAECRSRLNVNQDTLVLTIVATLFPYKGHADLIEALGHISDRLPEDWSLLVAGRDQGKIELNLRSRARDLSIEHHIHWLGEQAAIPELLCASDIGLLCSHEEGSPNAVIEGMASGLPMIATAVGGCPELITDGETGLLVPPQDPQALGAAILDLAQDPQKRQRLGSAGQSSLRGDYDLQTCVTRYERLYDALISGDQRPISDVLSAV